MPTDGGMCRFGQYSVLHRQVLDRLGYEDVPILSPSSQDNYKELGSLLRRSFWAALVCSDLLLKAAMKVRPDERVAGDTNTVLATELTRVESALAGGGGVRAALAAAAARFAAIPRWHEVRPLVGIVGEIYLRCDPFSNEDVIGAIERFGGEAWLSPICEWVHYTTVCQHHQSEAQGRPGWSRWMTGIVNHYMHTLEGRLIAATGPLLADRLEPPVETVLEYGRRYLPIEFQGETILTVGRAVAFAKAGASLVVNCAPFGCMPGTISTAIYRRVSADVGIPMVSLFYDGQGTQNQRLEVFLNNAAGRRRSATPAEARLVPLTSSTLPRTDRGLDSPPGEPYNPVTRSTGRPGSCSEDAADDLTTEVCPHARREEAHGQDPTEGSRCSVCVGELSPGRAPLPGQPPDGIAEHRQAGLARRSH
jgi:predicted nucleotide-binding protein (sugar kinase/HSP70/actin superfamily)